MRAPSRGRRARPRPFPGRRPLDSIALTAQIPLAHLEDSLTRIAICTTALCAVLALAAVALADSAERSAYKEAVEPICKANKEASKRILTGVEKMVREDKLKQAGTRFSRAAGALEKVERQLAAVPQPPEDAARLGKWLAGIKSEVALMRTIDAKFKAGNKARGSSLVVKLKTKATQTNNIVIVFQFDNCKIDPSAIR